VPKPGDRDEPDMLPAATQALPAQPPEGAAEEVRAGDAAAPSLDPSRLAARATAISILCRSSSLNLLKNRSRLRSRSRNRSVIKRQNSWPQRQKRLRQQNHAGRCPNRQSLRCAARCAEKCR
jgi:cell division septation protein DedD